MKAPVLETLVGAAVIAAAALFFIFAYRNSGYGGLPGGYHVTAQFNNIDGVNIGTEVRVAGIKVGKVVGQRLDPKSYQAHIDMMLQPQVQLSDDTSARISAEGLLGGKYIALEPGGSDTKLTDGSEISYTQGAVDIWSLISQAMFSRPAAAAPAHAGGGVARDPATSQNPGTTPSPQ